MRTVTGTSETPAPGNAGSRNAPFRGRRVLHRLCVIAPNPMPVALPPIPDLVLALRRLIDQVPEGRVTTPGRLASALGNAVAARWIGHYLLHHDHDAGCGCHRVLRAGGLLGPYPQGGDEKARRLRGGSGNGWRNDRSCAYDFADFTSDQPLENSPASRIAWRRRSSCGRVRTVPQCVGGVDVSYSGPSEGVAGYALVDVATGELLWSTTIRRPVCFPYITSYLTFRELPLLVDLIDEVRAGGRIAPVVLVDGTGILHPRQAGIASHLGVVAGLPTIGVTKKLLCGEVDIAGMRPLESRPVLFEDQPIGVAIRTASGSRRPLFISPGSGLDLASAEQIVRSVLTV